MRVKLFYIILVTMALMPYNSGSQTSKDSYSPASVLSSGQWFKLGVTQDGVYRIDFSRLKQLGLTNPSNPRIYANNQGQLSYYNSDPRTDDLREVAIMAVTGSDGIFNEGDYLLFYGEGTSKWKLNSASGRFDYIKHNYSDTAFYFLTSSPAQGKRIELKEEPEGAPQHFSSQSDVLYAHEQETENLIKSGREWFQPVSLLNGITVNPGFTGLVPGKKMKIRIRVAARAPVTTIFRFYEGETLQKNLHVQAVNMFAYTGTYAQLADSITSISPLASSPSFTLKFFNNGESAARGYLDYVILQGRMFSVYNGSNPLFLRDPGSIAPGRITEFSVKCPSGTPVLWEVTDPYNPGLVNYTRTGENIRFKTTTDSLKSYVLFAETNTLQPVIKSGRVINQDLHGSPPVEMVIITHPLFRQYAVKLAEMHVLNSGLVSLITTPEEIYNEFSGGTADIVAIRDFLRMKYLKQSGTGYPLKYLMLFGDGSYENRTLPPKNPNFIPTYQSQNSNVVVSSFTSDDFYGLLDDNEGEADGTEDLGIGRLPVSDTTQAGIVVRKIARYLAPGNKGDWKNVICITADDEDGNSHMSDAEGLSSFLTEKAPSFNIDKIYLDAYKQVTNVNGQSYPEVESAINNRINYGCLIFNYIGHGSENGLSHEGVIKTESINSWRNGAKLPLFITATCEFSRFDDMDLNIATREMTGKMSAGEKVLLNEYGGGIALMSTTRVVYSAPNYFLNKNIYNYAFNRDSNGNPLRLGDIIRLAKNASGSGPNKRNFSLLGDPAVRLAWPWHGEIITDSVNNVHVAAGTDSLKALSLVTVSGHIEGAGGELLSNFNGTLLPVVYDKVSSVKTLANDGGLPMKFGVRNNILFSGKTKVVNGRFRFIFLVPRDIDYSYGNGRISYYSDDGYSDMTGNYSDLIVGGFSESSVTDITGPRIMIFLNDTLFRSGGITGKNPTILAIIEDKGGINTTGAGIGHDLTAYIDNDRNKSFVLNNYFENDFDDYTKGRIRYNLPDLTEGSHSLTIKAWDNYNNSSEESIMFIVENDGKFILKNLMNYPNPVISETNISAEHNRPDIDLEITISIFDLSGRVIRIIKTTGFTEGYRLSPVVWDGNDEGGKRVGKGIYLYRVAVSAGKGERATATGRLIIL